MKVFVGTNLLYYLVHIYWNRSSLLTRRRSVVVQEFYNGGLSMLHETLIFVFRHESLAQVRLGIYIDSQNLQILIRSVSRQQCRDGGLANATLQVDYRYYDWGFLGLLGHVSLRSHPAIRLGSRSHCTASAVRLPRPPVRQPGSRSRRQDGHSGWCCWRGGARADVRRHAGFLRS